MNKKILTVLSSLLLIILIVSASQSLFLDNRKNEVKSFSDDTFKKLKEYIDFNFSLFEEKTNLFSEEITYWTNFQRESFNLEKLKNEARLNDIAEARIADMFENQYFSHLNSDGNGVGYESGKFDYQFITIAENIALGHFDGSKGLVESWMGSPGHKKNIISNDFSEIGVAAKKGIFEGKETWIAVQVFARPLSDCNSPNQSLKNTIEEKFSYWNNLKNDTQKIQNQMTELKENGYIETYNEKVSLYNGMARKANQLSKELKILIDSYNKEVGQFNECIK